MTATEARPRRWDIVVRATHWSIVAAIVANAIVTEEGSSAHVWVGYALAGVLGLRLAWGLVGPKRARFTAFPPSLARALSHLSDIMAGRKRDHSSHNPLGALMVYTIWATLCVIIASGIAMAGLPGAVVAPVENRPGITEQEAVTEASEAAGPTTDETGEAGGREDGPLGEVHEAAVNVLYLLIVLHIAGVIFESRRSGRQIVMAMMPGAR